MKLQTFLLPLFCTSVAACGSDEEPRQELIPFAPTEVHATRTQTLWMCDQPGPFPFTDDDVFSLQPVDEAAPNGVSSVAVMFTRRVTRDVPLHLEIGKPVFLLTGGPDQSASAPDPRIGAGVVVFTEKVIQAKPLAKAIVTVRAVPTKEGEPLSAHVTLEFRDGDVIDQTFTGTLVSQTGNCDHDGE